MKSKKEKWDLRNAKLDEDEFLIERMEVLKKWPTGKEVDLNEAIEYHKNMPISKNLPEVRWKAKMNKNILVQPRAGVATLEETKEMLKAYQDAGADALPLTIDSLTRNCKFAEVEKALEESYKRGRSMLNGFPAVNHGVKKIREVVEYLERPLNVRGGTCDGQLLAEVTFAGGITDILLGCVNYCLAYTKNFPLDKSIKIAQYVDRLTGYYADRGVILNKGIFGGLTGTLVPPSILNATSIIEELLGAEQGVKSMTLGYGEGGNLIQDVAGIRALEELGYHYLNHFGYNGVKLTTEFHQWLGGFPKDEAQAFGVIAWGTVIATLAGATMVMSKSTIEATTIPTIESNVAGMKTTKQIINTIKCQGLIENDEIKLEKEMIKKETKAIVDKTLELGDGDVAIGVIKAVESGIVDITLFSPSIYNANKVIPVRDMKGAIRFLDCGNLPFDNGIKEYHREKVAERASKEGRDKFELLIDDVYAFSEGNLLGTFKER